MLNIGKPKPASSSLTIRSATWALYASVFMIVAPHVESIVLRHTPESSRATIEDLFSIPMELAKWLTGGGAIGAIAGRMLATGPVYTKEGTPGFDKADFVEPVDHLLSALVQDHPDPTTLPDPNPDVQSNP